MKRRLGVEISASAVRMVEIESGGGRPVLVAFSEAPLPPGAMVDGTVADRAAVRRAVVHCAKGLSTKSASLKDLPEIWLAIAGLRAISREIQMPAVPDADLDAAVRLQALDVIPFPEDETLLSARSLGAAPGADGGSLMRVHLAAAHRALVEPLVEVLGEAGLAVAGVDLASSALVRALGTRGEQELASGAEAIVSIGAELTTIVVHERGVPHFVRTIAGGGNVVTRAISGALDIPHTDAEQIKIRLGWSPSDAGRLPAEAVAAARDGSAPLLGEIRSSIDYVATLPGVPDIARIVLTGGGSRLAGLVERLEYQVRIPVAVASWLDGVDPGPTEIDRIRADTVGAVACGAAIPEPSGRKQLDLLPPEVLLERRRARVAHGIRVAAVPLLVVLVAFGGLRYLQVHKAENGVGVLEGSVAVLQRQIPKYDRVQQEDEAILADSAMGLPIVSHEVNWPAVLADLAYYTPSSVSASGFSGTSSVVASAVTTSATSGAPVAPAPQLPAASDTVGTVSLSFTGPQYPSFKQWFDEVSSSKRFEIVSYSGVSGGKTGIAFTAQLAITGLIHTNRLSEFEVPKR